MSIAMAWFMGVLRKRFLNNAVLVYILITLSGSLSTRLIICDSVDFSTPALCLGDAVMTLCYILTMLI
jgi:hypothetical protein